MPLDRKSSRCKLRLSGLSNHDKQLTILPLSSALTLAEAQRRRQGLARKRGNA